MRRSSSSSSPSYKRPPPPERSRSGSQQQGSRWQKAKENEEDTQKTDDWETRWPGWPSQSWEEEGWDWQGKKDGWWGRNEDEWWGEKDGWWERKKDEWWGWEDWSDDQDSWSDDPQPQRRQQQPQKRPQKEGAPGSSRTSGSYMQKQRLQKLKELNSPKNEEEEQALKFFAIGRARFQRIQGRQQKQVAAQMQEQQAALERQQQELQQLYQQHHQQQQQQWQWQWHSPQVSWMQPCMQGGYLIHPGLTSFFFWQTCVFLAAFSSFRFHVLIYAHLFCFRWFWRLQPKIHWWCCWLHRPILIQHHCPF